MSKKFINFTTVEGYLYEHKLELREAGPNSKNPGTKFIMGTIDIATDEACTNIVPVHFTYVTPTMGKDDKKKPNPSYDILLNIVDGKFDTVMSCGKENAVKLNVSSSIGLNEFYTDRNGKEELVSAKRNEGGFVRRINVFQEDEAARNHFECDMLITGVREVEADEERGLAAKVIIRGAIFDFRGSLMPVEFSVTNPGGMNYFLGLEASNANPTFTKVWGNQISETINREIRTESAFGEDEVRIVKSSRKDFVVTGSSREPYAWDDEETLTAQEVAAAVAARETYLATIKQRQDEYKASKNAAPVAAKSNGGFNF